MDLASNESKNKKAAQKKISYRQGQVYTMRGVGGIFSKGMNRLEDTLEDDYHIRTASTIWYKAKPLSDFIIKNYKSKELQGPIILIGHSLGANEQIKVARNLEREHIPVALLMTIDAVSPVTVPPNVKHAFNIYKPGIVPMFSGLALKAMDPEFTHIDNFNVTRLHGVYVNHFTIDKNNNIQKIMLNKVLATLKESTKKQIS
ncbi:MAG: hypothetical protein Q8M03_02965 [Legionella sp.]|nr:hypothetical protein [Legionella sp.]